MSFADDNHRKWKERTVLKLVHSAPVFTEHEQRKKLNDVAPQEWDAAYRQQQAELDKHLGELVERELGEWLRRAQILIPDDDPPAAA